MLVGVVLAGSVLVGCGNYDPHGGNGWTFVGNDSSNAAINVKCDGTTLMAQNGSHDDNISIAANDPHCVTGTYDSSPPATVTPFESPTSGFDQ